MAKSGKRDLFRQVLWLEHRSKFDIDFFDLLQPQRVVSSDPRYKSGVFHSEKCRRDIQYESGMELAFIEFLEKDEKVLFYWEQPVRIKYWRGRKKVTYTPDFGIYLATREFVIAEVKDLSGMLDHRVQAKTEALMEFCSERGFGLLLTDGRNTPQRLLKGKINRKLEKEILTALEITVVRKEQCREIMDRCHATCNELYRTIIRHNLKFSPFPFKLGKDNKNRIFREVFFEKKPYDPFPSFHKIGFGMRPPIKKG